MPELGSEMPNEADTCRRYVVPKLQAAGWEDEPHRLNEQVRTQLLACNLDVKNPNSAEALEHLPPETLVEDILLKEQRIMELLGEVKMVLAEAPR